VGVVERREGGMEREVEKHDELDIRTTNKQRSESRNIDN
jgi:hypothetical protein